MELKIIGTYKGWCENQILEVLVIKLLLIRMGHNRIRYSKLYQLEDKERNFLRERRRREQ